MSPTGEVSVDLPTTAGSKEGKEPTHPGLPEAPQAAQHPASDARCVVPGSLYPKRPRTDARTCSGLSRPTSCPPGPLGPWDGKDGSSTVSVAGSACLWLSPQVAARRRTWTHSTMVSLVGPPPRLPEPATTHSPPAAPLSWLSFPGSLGLLLGWAVGRGAWD